MKEFIEKLIGRLEEHKTKAYVTGITNNPYEFGACNAMDSAISIVNQLAEEYKLFGNSEQVNNGWITCSERLPEDDTKRYMVQKTNGYIDILGFSKDAYRLSRYDFYEYKGKKKAIFFDYDSEYGYCEWECEAWQPLPPAYQPKGE